MRRPPLLPALLVLIALAWCAPRCSGSIALAVKADLGGHTLFSGQGSITAQGFTAQLSIGPVSSLADGLLP